MVQHVTAHHLTRLACLYVRQSTLQQVMENTESTSRQRSFLLSINRRTLNLPETTVKTSFYRSLPRLRRALASNMPCALIS